MHFFQDEFAGRVSAKVMQTALAVRDICFIVADILVFVTIYFVTMVAVVGHFNSTVMLPFLVWVVCYLGSLSYFVPRLAKVSQTQADARSLMTGRITDAYTTSAPLNSFPMLAVRPLTPNLPCRNFCTPCMRKCAMCLVWN
jgi:ATP-binding cassette subfamily B multidrug efflux pump